MPRRLQAAATFFVFALVASGVGVWFVMRPLPAYARGKNHFYIVETDFHFTPSHMVWHVGEHVWLTLVNDSQSKPPRIHEFHVGRDPVMLSTPFQGPKVGGWFMDDFFRGVVVRLSHTHNVSVVAHQWNPVVGPDANKPFVKIDPGGYSLATKSPAPDDQAINLNPGGTATIDFTVPDKLGTWGYACFRQAGQHYMNGMHGTITVVP